MHRFETLVCVHGSMLYDLIVTVQLRQTRLENTRLEIIQARI